MRSCFAFFLLYVAVVCGSRESLKLLHTRQVLSRDLTPPEAPFSFSWNNCGIVLLTNSEVPLIRLFS